MTDQPKQLAITHVTLYAGWPKGMSAMGVARQLFTDNK